MTLNISQAAASFAQAAAKAAKGVTDSNAGRPDTSFAELIAGAADGAIGAARRSESVSMRAVANQAELNEVVMAVSNAEVTLHTVVAIRDRIIQAYQDIIRMPI